MVAQNYKLLEACIASLAASSLASLDSQTVHRHFFNARLNSCGYLRASKVTSYMGTILSLFTCNAGGVKIRLLVIIEFVHSLLELYFYWF